MDRVRVRALATTAGLVLAIVIVLLRTNTQRSTDRATAVPPSMKPLPASVVPQPTPSPSFLVGWYDLASTPRLERQATTGANFALLNYDSPTALEAFLYHARRVGIQVMLQPDSKWVRLGQLGQLQDWIRRFQHYPAVWGWYLADEPDFVHLPPQRLIAAYDAIKEIDAHPVAVVFTSGKCRFGPGAIDAAYAPAFDILMFDDYESWTPISPREAVLPFRENFANCRESSRAFHKRGFLLVLQAFGAGQKDPGSSVYFRDPTSFETRYAFREAQSSGALGVLWYHDAAADARVRRTVEQVMRQR